MKEVLEISLLPGELGVSPKFNKKSPEYGGFRGLVKSAPSDLYQPNRYANTSGATIVASDSIMNLGVSTPILPQVIFSLGTAPE